MKAYLNGVLQYQYGFDTFAFDESRYINNFIDYDYHYLSSIYSSIHKLPADSEHSAIFQCLQGVPEGGLRRVILTASGGAFRDLSKDELFRMCTDEPRTIQAKATTHPNWDMGAKITLDSATMMNKGLEVIEAHYLFGASYDDIDIVSNLL